jgi:nicotinamide-nucleotide amidase
MFSSALRDEAARLLDTCRKEGLRIATAESCTGGLVAALLTEIADSSDVVECGFVTYSNQAKMECLGVPAALIARHGAVSEPVARAMAEGALRHANADIAVSVTGVAGPGGGSASKPVGLVHLACARKDSPTLHQECRFGDIGRDGVRLKAVEVALALVWGTLE